MKGKVKKGLLAIMLVLSLGFFFAACDDSGSGGGDSGDGGHCSDFDYPLYCPDAGVCCPRGKPVYCDGYCYENDPGGCTKIDRCYEE